jgi:HK97 family phage prohead protease
MSDEPQVLHRTFQMQLQTVEGRMLDGCVVPYGEASEVSDGGPSYYEVFEPGAFSRNLKAANRIALHYEHHEDLAHTIGSARSLHEEASGLYGTFYVVPGPFGDQALALVDEGILQGFSLGFTDRRRGAPKRTAQGTIVRDNCRLHEVSLCREPAYAKALVMAHRSKASWLKELEIPTVDDEQKERLRAVGIKV